MFHFYTPWKYQKTSSDVIRGYKSGTLIENGLTFTNVLKLIIPIINDFVQNMQKNLHFLAELISFWITQIFLWKVIMFG